MRVVHYRVASPGPEVVHDQRGWLVVLPGGLNDGGDLSSGSPHQTINGAFTEACWAAGWDSQHFDVAGTPGPVAEEVLT